MAIRLGENKWLEGETPEDREALYGKDLNDTFEAVEARASFAFDETESARIDFDTVYNRFDYYEWVINNDSDSANELNNQFYIMNLVMNYPETFEDNPMFLLNKTNHISSRSPNNARLMYAYRLLNIDLIFLEGCMGEEEVATEIGDNYYLMNAVMNGATFLDMDKDIFEGVIRDNANTDEIEGRLDAGGL